MPKPASIAFIRRQKYFNYEIFGRNFDLPAMQGKIELFAERYGLSRKFALRLQLCCEELIFSMIDGCYSADEKISVSVEIVYVEAEKLLELSLTCGGHAYNLFDEDDDANLSVKILRGCGKNFRYVRVDDLNKVTMEVVAP